MMAWKIGKLREIVKSVRAIPREIEIWRDTFGWTTRHEGSLTDDQMRLWHLSPPITGREYLCGFPNAEYGLLRLVEFRHCEQVGIRTGAQIWEPGGIFDFDLRVTDIAKTFNALRDAGWYVFGEPMEVRIGHFLLEEALLFGPEAAGLALVNRKEPPLPPTTAHNGVLGTIYLSVSVVKNIDVAAKFFTATLGFIELERLTLKNSAPAPTIFRLPWNLSTHVPVHLGGFSPDGSRDTIVEVFQFEGLYGEDRSARAVPPNRGLLLYRFPVEGIDEYFPYVSARTPVVTPLMELEIAPYGMVKAFAVRSPDGVWCEFFEEQL